MDEPDTHDEVSPSERYTKIFRHSNDAIMVVDFETETFVDVNQAACDLLGYDRETLLSMTPDEIHPDDMDTVRESFIADVRQSGSGWTNNLTCVTKQGREIPTEVSGAVLETEQQGTDPTRMIAILRDISERVRRRRELERQVQRLDRFAKTVSHDLKNPLTTLYGHLALARETGDEHHFEKMEDTIEEIDSLVDNVLTLAKAGSIDQRDLTSVNLTEHARNVWDDTRTKQATLQTTGSGEYLADPEQLRELFDNLFRNAVDHGPDDVTVTVRVTDDGFAVTDDGPGIPKQERDQVTEWGYTTAQDGTGFGLSIVGDIAAAHGWDLVISESEQGGAMFEISGVVRP